MKKILLFAVLLFSMFSANAQSASLTINNTNLVQWVNFRMYATDGVGSTPACNSYVAFTYDIAPGATLTFSDPCNFDATVGWNSSLSALGPGTVTTCPVVSIPAGFQWTQVDFHYISTPCGVGSGSIIGTVSPITWCATSSSASTACANGAWTPAAYGTTAMQNVTINFF